jgi:hypothetical protein
MYDPAWARLDHCGGFGHNELLCRDPACQELRLLPVQKSL